MRQKPALLYAARVVGTEIHQVGRVTVVNFDDRIALLRRNCHRAVEVVRTLEIPTSIDAATALVSLERVVLGRGSPLRGAWYRIDPNGIEAAFLCVALEFKDW